MFNNNGKFIELKGSSMNKEMKFVVVSMMWNKNI